MDLLDKPIYIKGLWDIANLSQDIRLLYDYIRKINRFKTGIFPSKLHAQIKTFLGEELPSNWFYKLENNTQSLLDFAALCRIVIADKIS